MVDVRHGVAQASHVFSPQRLRPGRRVGTPTVARKCKPVQLPSARSCGCTCGGAARDDFFGECVVTSQRHHAWYGRICSFRREQHRWTRAPANITTEQRKRLVISSCRCRFFDAAIRSRRPRRISVICTLDTSCCSGIGVSTNQFEIVCVTWPTITRHVVHRARFVRWYARRAWVHPLRRRAIRRTLTYHVKVFRLPSPRAVLI
jgi:hypothetical protein